ncbi:DUF2993 domain-containing protein [Rhodococcus rhodnii]|uniref:Secreted protein n=2 Tax=Rhodococcus rhodnii TaxID=38312 RepID=R7WK66_9NOCA|nr:LmeA family phospholipid-binding protein [Rhodococcus rhodnii]EOM74379.1 hypothetical protein Rrhod_4181 [Rhodococcus rhodnii LMG 5362]TXG89101.1 DUF2993 domain-containing protein [Rhodococcus rhodnii]
MRKLIAGLALLLGLAVLVDFGSAAYAEYRISRELRKGAELDADPEVTISGFSFLTQVADGSYRDIAIRAQGVRSDVVGEVTIEADLRGVHAPYSALVDGELTSLPVDVLEGRVLVGATELGRFLGIPDLEVSAPPASRSDGTGGSGGSGPTTAGGVVLTGTVPVGPIETTVSVQADLVLADGDVHIVASDFYFGPEGQADFSIPDPLEPVVLGLFTRTIDPEQLPFGVVPTEVYAEGSQIVVEGIGEDVTITLDEVQA